MTAGDCPDPGGCPVPDPPAGIDVDSFSVVPLEQGSTACRGYELKWGYDAFNPGFGDTRFAPLTSPGGDAIPTAYFGVDDVVVLLETVLHEVHPVAGQQIIYEALVRNWGIAFVTLPRQMLVVDLRDDALDAIGLARSELVTTTAEHYMCTREWADWFHRHPIGGVEPAGLLWHSRQAELHPTALPREVFVLWGDRAPSGPGTYHLAGPGVRNLTEGPGRVLLDELAEDLGALIEPVT